jgi:putative nucleotidyltransferase with HDIG domain
MKIEIAELRIGTILEGKLYLPSGEILCEDKLVFTSKLRQDLLSGQVLTLDYFPTTKRESQKTDHEKYEEDSVEKLLSGYHAGIFSKDSIKHCLASLRNLTFSFLTNHDSLDFRFCKNSILQVYEDIKTNPSALVNLLDIKSHDDYTFCHSVNVAIISLSLAKKMGYPEDEVQIIGLGGLLHDIGKIAVPASLINKTTVLSEEEKRIMKSHPSHSYRIMNQIAGLDRRIVKMAYEHHERYDGNGYPRGVAGDVLHDHSVIVALADVYDALTTVRSYKPAFSPEESIQVIETYTGTHFAPRIAERFIRDIQSSIHTKTEYKKGSLVLLSTNELAQIIFFTMNHDGPEIIVQVLTKSDRTQYKKPRRINLKVDKKIAIKRIVSKEEVNWETLRVRMISSTNLDK